MTVVTVHEAKTHLSRLINDVLAGKEVIVRRGKIEVIKLVPAQPAKPTKKPDRQFGWLAHELPEGAEITGPGFWEPLSDEDMGLADLDSDPLSPTYRG